MPEQPEFGQALDQIIRKAQIETLRDAADAVPVDLWATYGMANRLHVEGFQEWLRERADRMEGDTHHPVQSASLLTVRTGDACTHEGGWHTMDCPLGRGPELNSPPSRGAK